MARSFTLLRTLGEGAYGAVHLAEVREDDDFVQTLAVKWLHPRWSGEVDLVRRLRDEARLLGLLRHEHIVRVHGLTRIEGRLAILMEPVDGVDLARIGRAPPRVAAEICGAVADALSAAWSTVPPGGDAPLRVVHRDIKPSNVMVTRRGAVKVMDFGVARATFDAREASTHSQQFGTARYMAPERWLDGVADAPSDVYSLGITLVELVGGAAVEQPRLSREGFADDLRRALGSVDDELLRALAERMCAFDPSARPTAAEVAAACLSLASALPGPDLRSWATVALPSVEAPPGAGTGTIVVEDTPVPTTGPPATPRRGSTARWGIAAAVLLAVVVGVPIVRRAAPAPPVRPPLASAPAALAPVSEAPARVAPEPVATPVEPPEPSPPRPRAPPAPRPPQPEPAPEPEPPRSTVTFVVDPGLVVETSDGSISGPRHAMRLAADRTHQLTVREGEAQWGCTIVVGTGPTTVQVRSRDRGGCRQ